MNLVVQDTYELAFDDAAPGSVWLDTLLAFEAGRAVALVRSVDAFWLVEMGTARGVVQRAIPAAIATEFRDEVRGDDGKLNFPPWSLLAFKFGERVGLLLCDRKLYLFDDIAGDPVSIDIGNRFPQILAFFDRWHLSFRAIKCGNSASNAVPVIFQHPDDSEYPGFVSLLDIDAGRGTALWRAQPGQYPLAVKFREHRYVLDERGHKGSLLHSVAWTGDKFLIFSIGARNAFFRVGMTYSVLLNTDENAQAPQEMYECDENVFGDICATLDKVILTPLYKNGTRKGKQSLFDIGKNEEHSVKLPRGYAKFKLVEAREQYAWLVSEGGKGPPVCARCVQEG